MSNKPRRRVTVESSKPLPGATEKIRKPSVFERLGPGAPHKASRDVEASAYRSRSKFRERSPKDLRHKVSRSRKTKQDSSDSDFEKSDGEGKTSQFSRSSAKSKVKSAVVLTTGTYERHEALDGGRYKWPMGVTSMAPKVDALYSDDEVDNRTLELDSKELEERRRQLMKQLKEIATEEEEHPPHSTSQPTQLHQLQQAYKGSSDDSDVISTALLMKQKKKKEIKTTESVKKRMKKLKKRKQRVGSDEELQTKRERYKERVSRTRRRDPDESSSDSSSEDERVSKQKRSSHSKLTPQKIRKRRRSSLTPSPIPVHKIKPRQKRRDVTSSDSDSSSDSQYSSSRHKRSSRPMEKPRFTDNKKKKLSDMSSVKSSRDIKSSQKYRSGISDHSSPEHTGGRIRLAQSPREAQQFKHSYVKPAVDRENVAKVTSPSFKSTSRRERAVPHRTSIGLKDSPRDYKREKRDASGDSSSSERGHSKSRRKEHEASFKSTEKAESSKVKRRPSNVKADRSIVQKAIARSRNIKTASSNVAKIKDKSSTLKRVIPKSSRDTKDRASSTSHKHAPSPPRGRGRPEDLQSATRGSQKSIPSSPLKGSRDVSRGAKRSTVPGRNFGSQPSGKTNSSGSGANRSVPPPPPHQVGRHSNNVPRRGDTPPHNMGAERLKRLAGYDTGEVLLDRHGQPIRSLQNELDRHGRLRKVMVKGKEGLIAAPGVPRSEDRQRFSRKDHWQNSNRGGGSVGGGRDWQGAPPPHIHDHYMGGGDEVMPPRDWNRNADHPRGPPDMHLGRDRGGGYQRGDPSGYPTSRERERDNLRGPGGHHGGPNWGGSTGGARFRGPSQDQRSQQPPTHGHDYQDTSRKRGLEREHQTSRSPVSKRRHLSPTGSARSDGSHGKKPMHSGGPSNDGGRDVSPAKSEKSRDDRHSRSKSNTKHNTKTSETSGDVKTDRGTSREASNKKVEDSEKSYNKSASKESSRTAADAPISAGSKGHDKNDDRHDKKDNSSIDGRQSENKTDEWRKEEKNEGGTTSGSAKFSHRSTRSSSKDRDRLTSGKNGSEAMSAKDQHQNRSSSRNSQEQKNRIQEGATEKRRDDRDRRHSRSKSIDSRHSHADSRNRLQEHSPHSTANTNKDKEDSQPTGDHVSQLFKDNKADSFSDFSDDLDKHLKIEQDITDQEPETHQAKTSSSKDEETTKANRGDDENSDCHSSDEIHQEEQRREQARREEARKWEETHDVELRRGRSEADAEKRDKYDHPPSHSSPTKQYYNKHDQPSRISTEDHHNDHKSNLPKPADSGGAQRGSEPVEIDYEEISDDDLSLDFSDDGDTGVDDLQQEKAKGDDTLAVDWESLKPLNIKRQEKQIDTTRRFTPAHIFGSIGISRSYAGDTLVELVKSRCQAQLNEEAKKANESQTKPDEGEQDTDVAQKPVVAEKFGLLHDVAALHCAARQARDARTQLVQNVGTHCRAICAYRDLQIRRKLCKLEKELENPNQPTFSTQAPDRELYKQSLMLLKRQTPLLGNKLLSNSLISV